MRAAPGGGGGTPERNARMRRRQHDAQAERRGADASPHVYGALAARHSGTGLTVNDDNAFRPSLVRPNLVGPNRVGNEAERNDSCRCPDSGRSLQCCDHLEPLDLWNLARKLSRASNHPGETLTLDEQTFEVKGKYERVFAPNA